MGGHYWIGYHSYYGEDGYTVASRHYRNWLPEVAGQTGGGPTGSPNSQRFLRGLESSSGTEGETITLGELKSKIAEIEAEIVAGGGSDEYRECVRKKYFLERWSAHTVSKFGGAYNFDPYEHTLESGLAVETLVYEDKKAQDNISRFGENPSEIPYRYWLEGEDRNLFDVGYPGRVLTRRPLPAGRYEFYYNDQESELVLCNAYPEAERTRFRHVVTVTAPAGVLHEAFFDPVTVGSAVLADGTNGVLKPASFTDANGSSATIERIGWESVSGRFDIVSIKVGSGSASGTGPNAALVGHVVDFIELDGTVSLSLDAVNATVNVVEGMLIWSVPSQPWEDGDKLMLRIREALP